MGMHEGTGQLAKAMKILMERWMQTRGSWDDEVSIKFEKTFLEPLNSDLRSALNAIDAHSETTAMVGDRMETDVVSGLEAGMHTVLVLTGSTSREEAERFPFVPSRIVDSIADLLPELN